MVNQSGPATTASAVPWTRGVDTRREGKSRTLGRVDVLDTLAAAEPAWTRLEAECGGSIYQTRRFLQPWIETFGARARTRAMIVVARDASGDPVALLPFGVTRRGPVRIAGFLGGTDSNANLGLFRPDTTFTSGDLESLLRAAAAKATVRPDVFLLENQPKQWEGRDNPLDVFSTLPSASFSHRGALAEDPRVFLGRLSKDTAKKLRTKQKRLEEQGALTLVSPTTPAEISHVLDAFFAQKLATFREKHIHSEFGSPEARSFLERACSPGADGSRPAIELHALALGGRVVATYGGGVHREHLHLMFNSYDIDPEIARSSPGDLLLQMLLERKCREKLRSFDLGIGEARYKSAWCDASEPMFDSVLAISAPGHAFRVAEIARRAFKRRIKQSSWAWPVAQILMRRV